VLHSSGRAPLGSARRRVLECRLFRTWCRVAAHRLRLRGFISRKPNYGMDVESLPHLSARLSVVALSRAELMGALRPSDEGRCRSAPLDETVSASSEPAREVEVVERFSLPYDGGLVGGPAVVVRVTALDWRM